MSHSCHRWVWTRLGWDCLFCRRPTRAHTGNRGAQRSCPCPRCPSSLRLRGRKTASQTGNLFLIGHRDFWVKWGKSQNCLSAFVIVTCTQNISLGLRCFWNLRELIWIQWKPDITKAVIPLTRHTHSWTGLVHNTYPLSIWISQNQFKKIKLTLKWVDILAPSFLKWKVQLSPLYTLDSQVSKAAGNVKGGGEKKETIRFFFLFVFFLNALFNLRWEKSKARGVMCTCGAGCREGW